MQARSVAVCYTAIILYKAGDRFFFCLMPQRRPD